MGIAPIIFMGLLSLGTPERGAAEKIVENKERTKGWDWGRAMGVFARRWLGDQFLD